MCLSPFPALCPPRTGRYRKGMNSARPSYQGVRRSFCNPETFAPGGRHVPRGAPSRGSGYVIGTDRWRSEPPCVRKGVPHGQTESGVYVLDIICWSTCAQRLCLLHDRALCLPTFSHFLFVNETSLSLSLPAHPSLSLTLSHSEPGSDR